MDDSLVQSSQSQDPEAEGVALRHAITSLVEIAGRHPRMGEAALVDALTANGVEHSAAQRLVLFTPIAFGRHLMRPWGCRSMRTSWP